MHALLRTTTVGLILALASPTVTAQSLPQAAGWRRAATLQRRPGFPLFPNPFLVAPNTPSASIAADFDGDGGLDLAVAGLTSGVIATYRGRGDGTFLDPVNYTAASQPRALRVGDHDGDGDQDIFVALRSTSRVGYLRNRGDGTFDPLTSWSVGGSTNDLALGDVDGDGDLDVVAPVELFGPNDAISVSINTGAGNFASPVLIVAGTGVNASVELGDLDLDGDLDLVAVDHFDAQGFVLTFLNSGGGSFGPPVSFPAGPAPGRIRIADLDLDGDPDFVLGNNAVPAPQGFFSVLVNSGAATFATRLEFPTGAGPFHILVADLDRDGDPDVVTPNADSDDLSIHSNQGGLAFTVAQILPIPARPWDLCAADLNADGEVDLIPCSYDSNRVYQFMNRGGGSFPQPQALTMPERTYGFAAGDLSGDGRPDLVTTHQVAQRIEVRTGLGGGAFSPPTLHPAPTYPFSSVLYDFDRDGTRDVVALNAGGVVSFLRNPGSGALDPVLPIPTPTVMEVSAYGDLDADGDTDVVGELLGNTSLRVMWNNAGSFTTTTWAGVGFPRGVVIEDFNQDGLPDVAFTTSVLLATLQPRAYIGWNLGGGVLQAPVLITPPTEPAAVDSLRAFDMDADGDLDLVSFATTSLNILRNQGGGSFLRETISHPHSLILGRDCADVDLDGHVDLLLTMTRNAPVGAIGSRGSELTVHHGSMNGTYARTSRFAIPAREFEIRAGDFDADGDPDLALAGTNSNQLLLLSNGRR